MQYLGAEFWQVKKPLDILVVSVHLYDDELEANKKRVEHYWIDDDGNEQSTPVSGFEWYLTHNFFTFDQIVQILKDIADTVDALTSGRETEYTKKLKIKRGTATYQLLYAKDLNEEEVAEYNANRPTEDDTEVGLVVDFISVSSTGWNI